MMAGDVGARANVPSIKEAAVKSRKELFEALGAGWDGMPDLPVLELPDLDTLAIELPELEPLVLPELEDIA